MILLIVNLDDCWQQSRDAQGIIRPDSETFPSGIRALADYIHSKKLKFGLYSGTVITILSLSIASTPSPLSLIKMLDLERVVVDLLR